MRGFHTAVTLFLVILAAIPRVFSAEAPSADLKAVVNGNTQFALDLYSKLKETTEANLFFSPYSISVALAMTYGGARGNTAKEMENSLHFTLKEKTHLAFAELDTRLDEVQRKRKVQLHIANSLWPQKDYRFLPEYISLIKQHYGVSITPLDYTKAVEEACRIINKWVEDETKEKIKDLIRKGGLNPLVRLVLVNAIYFKGDWASQFDPKQTANINFTLLNGEKKRVPMMQQKGKFRYREIEKAQLLELPYIGKQLSMIILLPQDPNGLSDIENQLSERKLDSWFSNLTEEEVKVYLPKFKITWGTFELNDQLKALGMRDAFVFSRADFSGMDGTKDLYISLVLHKAFVEVNEEGTEAAAATAVTMKVGGRLPRIRTFKADHPFVFFIRDNTTGSILFLGRVVDPSKKEE
ncbi:MAG: serpin family protein [bacterium]